MTRFARAKGSKASNERVPEEATSWRMMKEQLEQKKQEVLESKKRKEFEAVRRDNYKAFLEERQNDVKPEWVEFEGSLSNLDDHKNKKKYKNKKLHQNNENLENDDNLQKIISKIEHVLSKDDETQNNNKSKKKKKNMGGNTDLIKSNDEIENDDAPEEVSAKIIPVPTPTNKKSKIKLPKKTVLKIPSVNSTDKSATNNGNALQEIHAGKEKDNLEKKGNKKVVKHKITNQDIGLHKVKDSLSEEKNKNSKEKQKAKKKNVSKNGGGNVEVIKPTKSLDEMTEDEIKRINKKKAKRMRQLQNRKKFRAEQREKALREQQTHNFGKRKLPKERDNEEHKRRKPNSQIERININGVEVDIDYYDGFPVKKEDAQRLRQLRKEMISKGVPRSEVQVALKLERRKAEKALAREKKKVCFNCRKSGHVLSECPNLNENSQQEIAGTGICFKCGSTEHTHFECKVVRNDDFKYATCFICREQGHISRQCPDNQKGLYPKGGACKICGDVTHLKKDCPKFQTEQESNTIKLDTLEFSNVEGLSDEKKNRRTLENKKSSKVIKF